MTHIFIAQIVARWFPILNGIGWRKVVSEKINIRIRAINYLVLPGVETDWEDSNSRFLVLVSVGQHHH